MQIRQKLRINDVEPTNRELVFILTKFVDWATNLAKFVGLGPNELTPKFVGLGPTNLGWFLADFIIYMHIYYIIKQLNNQIHIYKKQSFVLIFKSYYKII